MGRFAGALSASDLTPGHTRPPALSRPLHSAFMFEGLDLARRARAAGIHLLISGAVSMLAAALVFGFWYPGAYRLLSGGRDLFLLVIAVDVVLGPLLTFAVFNLNKGWRHLRRDLAFIGLIQLAALSYGLHTVYVARPVALVFEVDRFRAVTASDVHRAELPMARPEYQTLPLTGPWQLSTRPPEPGDERNDALFMAVSGIDVGQRPKFWRPYEDGRADILARSRPFADLLDRYPDQAEQFNGRLTEAGLPASAARFLPVVARGDWVAVLDTQGNIAVFLPVDGFF